MRRKDIRVRRPAWRETPFFDERERAALEWTEAVTRVADTHVPDDVYERVKRQFNEAELIDLTLAIANINTRNRLNVAFRSVPGGYRAGMYRNMMAGAATRHARARRRAGLQPPIHTRPCNEAPALRSKRSGCVRPSHLH